MASNPRAPKLPPRDIASIAFASIEIDPARKWHRLHFPGRALYFSKNAEHRFSPPDGKYEVLYLASDRETATLEVYGDRLFSGSLDIARSEYLAREFSEITCPKVVCANLTKSGLKAARVDMGTLMHSERGVTHAWALAVMGHPAGFHGLLFISRFTGRECLALFHTSDATPLTASAPKKFAGSPESAGLLAERGVNIV